MFIFSEREDMCPSFREFVNIFYSIFKVEKVFDETTPHWYVDDTFQSNTSRRGDPILTSE